MGEIISSQELLNFHQNCFKLLRNDNKNIRSAPSESSGSDKFIFHHRIIQHLPITSTRQFKKTAA